MTFIKICGITNLEDALLSLEAGADALGFNFYPRSPRYVTPKAAREIIDRLPKPVLTVGVFVNEEDPESVKHVAECAGVSALQLHGDESPQYCFALRDRFLIKAVAVKPGFELERALDYKVAAIMLDSYHPEQRGGTGRNFDWSIAQRMRRLIPKLFLAGGLTSHNVAEAITMVQPYGVDACSGLEITPGRKNAKAIEAFVKAARSAQRG